MLKRNYQYFDYCDNDLDAIGKEAEDGTKPEKASKAREEALAEFDLEGLIRDLGN